MNKFLYCILFLSNILILPQTRISGKIIDESNIPVAGANVYIKDSYDGASSDSLGNFSFKTSEKGEVILVASFIGYKTWELKINLKKDEELKIDIILIEDITTLKTVVISAGFFEASDEKKSVILNPIDIVTTGAQADVYAALNTLPGAQQVGEQEGLFVRGGDAVETKIFIDELPVQKPFFSSIPDVPSRGRFNAFYFKGTLFSTGGYSAQYGQALSSALILKTEDLPELSYTAINLMAVGVGAATTHRFENASISVEANWYNLDPYFKWIRQRQKYDYAPRSGDINLMLRYKPSQTGMIKLYTYYNASKTIMYIPDDFNPLVQNRLELFNNNTYLNANYRDVFGKWNFFIGSSVNIDKDDLKLSADNILDKVNLYSAKTNLVRNIFGPSTISFGGEIIANRYDQTYNIYNRKLDEVLSSGYVESDIFITKSLALRTGLRFEHSKVLDNNTLAPRISLAYKLDELGQFNFAYGTFYQNPDKDYMFVNSNLNNERAEHYILNYQIIGEKQTFRVEGYYKKYSNLVKAEYPDGRPYNTLNNSMITNTNNNGSGFAKGIDVFWRDKESFSNVDYWLSYSFLDTKRDFRDYINMAVPPFAAKHTFSAVVKHYIESISTNIGLTYTFASGRTYFNPNNQGFLVDKSRNYNQLSLNVTYLTYLFGNYLIIFASVENPVGFSNVYGYKYSFDGSNRVGIVPPSMRTGFIGIFYNIEH